MRERSLDLMKQYAGTFKGQKPLAFFDLEVEGRNGARAATGLCKISAAVKPGSGTNCLSLVFVADVSDPLREPEVRSVLDALSEKRLRDHLPELQYTVSPQPLLTAPESLVKQIDLVLDPGFPLDLIAVCGRIHAAIRGVQGIKAGEPVWWESPTGGPAGAHTAPAGATSGERSLVRRLLALLGRH
jgi:hypothetical protein